MVTPEGSLNIFTKDGQAEVELFRFFDLEKVISNTGVLKSVLTGSGKRLGSIVFRGKTRLQELNF